MPKIDYKKERKDLYSPSAAQVTIVSVPAFHYLMVDGQGVPDGKEAQAAFAVLFPAAYKLKFLLKKQGQDYGVMPLEGLWWADDMADFVNGKRDQWKWTYMIRQPDFITPEDFEQVVAELKKKGDLPNLSALRLEEYSEGQAAQLMHIGPFANEGSNIQKIHKHIQQMGGTFDGYQEKHHEIYLSDFRRVDPLKMKTILRQPFHLAS